MNGRTGTSEPIRAAHYRNLSVPRDIALALLHAYLNLGPAEHFVVRVVFRATCRQRHRMAQQAETIGVRGDQQHHIAARDAVLPIKPHLIQLKRVVHRENQRGAQLALFPVDHDSQFERGAEIHQGFDHRPIGGDPAASPTAVDAFACLEDRGIGADVGVVQKGLTVDRRHMHRATVASGDDVDRLFKVLWNTHRPREIVEGALRDDAERTVVVYHGRGNARDRAIPARDGNDPLAVYAATQWAANRARLNAGPTIIEHFTYRSEAHSTSDDPSGYRSAQEREEWPLGDPINRLKQHCIKKGIWDEERHAEQDKELAESVRATGKEAEKLGVLGHGMHQPFRTMFEDVFEEMPWHLKEQAEMAISERKEKFPKGLPRGNE